MKVVAVLGSPRKESNSAKLAEAVLKISAAQGAEIRRFWLNDLKFKGCQACMSCKGQSETCVVMDDLTQVLAEAAAADRLILASPVYMGEISSQMKGFIDRTYSYFVPDFGAAAKPSRLAPGKKLLFILTQSQANKTAFEASVAGHYLGYFKAHGFEVHHFIAPGQSMENIETAHPGLVKALLDQAAKMA